GWPPATRSVLPRYTPRAVPNLRQQWGDAIEGSRKPLEPRHRGGVGAAGRGQAVRQDRAHALAMRWRTVLACTVLILAAAGPAVADDGALRALPRAGGPVIML